MTFTFNLHSDELKQIIEHTIKHPQCKVAYQETDADEPCLFLVKDEGAYLMTASKTPLLKENPTGPKAHRAPQVVAYAQGHGPDDGWIGGDDFAENIPLKWLTNAIAAGHKVAIFILGPEQMEFQSA